MRKRLLTILVLIALFAVTLCGCSEREIIASTVTDKTYTPAYVDTYSETIHKYNHWTGEYQLVPEIKTRYVPECWLVTVTHQYADDYGNCQEEIEVTSIEWDDLEIGSIWKPPND